MPWLGSWSAGAVSNNLGVDLPLMVDGMGHYVSSVVTFGDERNLLRNVSAHSVSYFEWGASMKRPDLHDGGRHLPFGGGRCVPVWPPRNVFGIQSDRIGRCGGFVLVGPKANYEMAR